MTTSPHDAIGPALAFVEAYLTQIDRMYGDITRWLAEGEPAWQRLRRAGDGYTTESRLCLGEPGRFLPKQLGHFYAPQACFPSGKTYGVPLRSLRRVAFVTTYLVPGEPPVDGQPSAEMTLGWLEGLSGNPDASVETLLSGWWNWLDPDETVPPLPVTRARDAARGVRAEELVFEVRPFRAEGETLRMAMVRIDLAEVHDGQQVKALVEAFRDALGDGVS